MSYDQITGILNGKVNIRGEVTVKRGGDNITGTLTIDVFDPTGTNRVDPLEGEITGERVTVENNNAITH